MGCGLRGAGFCIGNGGGSSVGGVGDAGHTLGSDTIEAGHSRGGSALKNGALGMGAFFGTPAWTCGT